jgi:glucose-6-phosphate dehydrogenase assembly protein OpcA
MALTLESLTGGAPRPVAIAELEAELSALWRSAGEGKEESAVTRACAFTLLVYVESEEAAREVSALVASLTRQNPCRAVIMVVEPGAAGAELRAAISAHCHLPVGGEKQVCCEQVTVNARGEAVRDLAQAVLPLIVSDLPAFLWWRAGRFAPPPSLDKVLRVSSRVIVDSARFADAEADLRSLWAKDQEISAQDVWLGDLNWTRITPWRELIAQCFDAPDSRRILPDLTEVHIEFERHSVRKGAQEVQALLLAGWLASRLGWRPRGQGSADGADTRTFQFDCPKGQVRVECAGRDYSGGGAGVCFRIILRGGEPPATCTLTRGEDGQSVETRVELPGQQPIVRAVRLAVLDESDLAGQELGFSGRDHVFEDALQMVAQMTA